MFIKTFLLLSIILIVNSPISINVKAAAAGVCSTITSTQCPEFSVINAKVTQAAFDSLVQSKYNELKTSLKGTGASCGTYESDFSSNVRFLKTLSCSLIIREQGCNGSSSICPNVCGKFTTSLNSVSCINNIGKSNISSQCVTVAVQKQDCLDYFNVELSSCGFEDASAKAAFCALSENSTSKCCGGNGNAAGTAGSGVSSTGVQGTAGTASTVGTTGAAGTSGTVGTTGTINSTGVSGNAGTNGVPNVAGSTGNTGTTGTTGTSTTKPIGTTSSNTTSTGTTKTDNTSTDKKKGGGFFTSKLFIILAIILFIIIGILGYFYYVGSKDEKEENMRNLENGSNNYNYGDYKNDIGGTQTIEINKNQNLSDSYNNYNNNLSSYPYDAKPTYGNQTTDNPFADSNQVDPISPYDNTYNSNYNQPYTDKSYNEIQNSVSYQNPALVAAPVTKTENPFDSPKLDVQSDMENQINKSMQELSKNFPVDDMPTPSVVKITEIEKPKQGNTNTDEDNTNNETNEDILKPSMVRMTNIDTPVPANTIPTDKDISIGDDVLKPSMVTLTEIQTPQETSINNESKENEKDSEKEEEEPKKAVVNMIDLKTPSSNEALNAGNLLTPSIMITSTDGKVSEAGLSQDEEVPEEYSEMPEPRPFRAIHAYEPQIDDELRLVVDNEIDVLYEYDDGWCWAINKTTGEQGACPLLCLVSAQEEASGEREWEKEMDVMKVPGRRESMLSNSFDTSRLSFQKK